MFNPEKLLNKVISEMAGSAPELIKGKKYKKKKKKKKKDKAKGLSDSLVSNLTSGKGLMTAIALGVGAYTIVKSKQSSVPGTSTVSPPLPSTSNMTAPPPLPEQTTEAVAETVPGPVPAPSTVTDDVVCDLAIRLIQVMIAAAWADGKVDAEEESQILARLQDQGLDKEEKLFLLNELHDPKPIVQLTTGVDDPRVAQTMYSLAVATLVIDTEEERNWLNKLAEALSISSDMQSFIEEDM